ncbi:hypothetical protein [Priestia megaterium]|uniref:hypothetical protein n=1 Tax=Priestia megaterium TaxID=1404 RepID=UPI000BFE3723|nr:hypothetical protein [Priestia megaterium]PGY51514.1 hypothetical protein COE35_13570 [Priestia megaterium]
MNVLKLSNVDINEAQELKKSLEEVVGEEQINLVNSQGFNGISEVLLFLAEIVGGAKALIEITNILVNWSKKQKKVTLEIDNIKINVKSNKTEEEILAVLRKLKDES